MSGATLESVEAVGAAVCLGQVLVAVGGFADKALWVPSLCVHEGDTIVCWVTSTPCVPTGNSYF